MEPYLGKGQTDLLAWLTTGWLTTGKPVCFLEGFSGIGKTTVARELEARLKHSHKVVRVDMPEAEADPVGDLLLEIATRLHELDHNEIADAINDGRDKAAAALVNLLRSSSIVIVIDEFQRAIRKDEARPVSDVEALIARIAERTSSKGRALLLTSRRVAHEKWSEPYEIRTLPGLTVEEAEQLLEARLADEGRADDVPPERRRDVVNWLGRNPRAVRVLVAALAEDALDYLINLNPESWEARDREVSAELLRSLERNLLERNLVKLETDVASFLNRLSVYRRALKREAMQQMVSAAKFEALKSELINRFFVELHLGWFSLHEIVREIALQKLKQNPEAFRQAHSKAGEYFARPFKAKQIVGGELGAQFVEARYHFVQAQRDDALSEIAKRFGNYLKETFSATTPIPKRETERDERIAVLSALLVTPGPKSLEHYLARLLKHRGNPLDLKRALEHARVATDSRDASSDVWWLRIGLEQQVHGVAEAIKVARQGIAQVPREQSAPLYKICAQLMAKAGRTDEAISLLKDGISKVAQEDLATLYETSAELIAGAGRANDAIKLLREGVHSIPVGQWNRYYLITPAILLCAVIGDQATLDTILSGTGPDLLEPQQLWLGGTIRLQMQHEWKRAAEYALRGRKEFPNYLPLATLEAFSWLCINQQDSAERALREFPSSLQMKKYSVVAWLLAFIHVRRGNMGEARACISAYLDRSVTEAEDVSETRLLRLWDTTLDPFAGPAFLFPMLPPSLTGLPEAVMRQPHSAPVLPDTLTQLTRPGTSVTPAQDGRRKVLVIATEWDSKYGGLSTFNRGLCKAMARAGHGVCCVVPRATPDEIAASKAAGVELVQATPTEGASDRELLFRRPALPSGFDPDVIIGHDRITGAPALLQAEDYFPQAYFVLFIHTAPGEIEWYKPRGEGENTAAETAEQREEAQRELGRKASLVVAVGPRLKREIEANLIRLNTPVMQFNPGLGETKQPGQPLAAIYCLLLGRAEDENLKGLDIAARALGQLSQKQPRPFSVEPELIVRGAAPKTGDQLRERLISIGGAALNVRVKEYTPLIERVTEDIQRASVLLMPSRREGFGLVGLEAIGFGIPILVSSKSGLGELLKEKLLSEMSMRHVVEVTGDLETDYEEWAKAIEFVLRDRKQAFARVADLQHFLSSCLSWDQGVADLFHALRGVKAASHS